MSVSPPGVRPSFSGFRLSLCQKRAKLRAAGRGFVLTALFRQARGSGGTTCEPFIAGTEANHSDNMSVCQERGGVGGKGEKRKRKVTNAPSRCIYDRNLVFGYAGGRIRYGAGKLERILPKRNNSVLSGQSVCFTKTFYVSCHGLLSLARNSGFWCAEAGLRAREDGR